MIGVFLRFLVSALNDMKQQNAENFPKFNQEAEIQAYNYRSLVEEQLTEPAQTQ